MAWVKEFQRQCARWHPGVTSDWHGVSPQEVSELNVLSEELTGLSLPEDYSEFLVALGRGTGCRNIDSPTAPGATRGSWHYDVIKHDYQSLIDGTKNDGEVYLKDTVMFSVGDWIASQIGICPMKEQKVWSLCDYELSNPLADTFPQFVTQQAFAELVVQSRKETRLSAPPCRDGELRRRLHATQVTCVEQMPFSCQQTLCVLGSQAAAVIHFNSSCRCGATFWDATEGQHLARWLVQAGFVAL